ncbi:hypothetical protein FRC08_007888 [Ceratobasidium sp. 394]|nr:hypothetical protein FRC08_007888 [Ceratobasidium sp. 394]KAG9096113.1 hypothetical protein FS749_009103 [Ceratobasidium sp. UAMH 11750]
MPPTLKVSVGPNVDELKEITYNDNSSHAVRSPDFDGLISVHIKGDGGFAKSRNDTYFTHESRSACTWAIQIQGRFLKEINGNDVLFGNIFDRPLPLPWGSSAILSFVQYIDPTLNHDIYGEKPWALSPFLSTMPYLQRTQIAADTPVPNIPTTLLTEEKSQPPLAPALKGDSTPETRWRYFGDEAHRKQFTFTPKDLISADFCYGYLQLPGLTLTLPGGLEFDLMYYYDGRPVNFICKERGTNGKTFFVVSFIVFKDGGGSDTAPIDSSEID